jgi:xylulokinase
MPEQGWSEALTGLLQVPREKLPEIGRSSDVAGYVTKEAASATGLKSGTPVVYGGGDSHCALVGLGLVGSGEGGLLLGTNSTLRVTFDTLLPLQGHSVWLQQHVVPHRFTVSASSMAGSSVLDWFLSAAPGSSPAGETSFDELDSMAAGVPAGSAGLLFHPYLHGERSPFYNPNAGGAFLGIRHRHGREHMVRSILEGVAFSIANCLDAIQSMAREQGRMVTRLRTGQSGGSRLPTWLQIITDVLEQPLQIVAVAEPGCLGAGILAGAGTGAYAGVQDGIKRAVRVGSETCPDGTKEGLYRERRSAFNDTYRSLESRLYEPND